MTAQNSITLWHLEDCGTRIVRTFFANVNFHIEQSFAKSGIKEKGFHPTGTAVVRIPTKENIVVFPGDYIAPGYCIGDEPDYQNSFKVTAVCDNRKGASPHWKLLCGGQR